MKSKRLYVAGLASAMTLAWLVMRAPSKIHSHTKWTIALGEGENLASPAPEFPSSTFDVIASNASGAVAAPETFLTEPGSRTALRAAIVEAEDHLRPSERAAVFERSGFNTPAVASAARAALATPYSADSDDAEIERKVFALHVIGLSSHVSVQQCEDTLASLLEGAREQGSSPSRAALLDILGVGKVCAWKDADTVRRRWAELPEGAVRAELALALEAVTGAPPHE